MPDTCIQRIAVFGNGLAGLFCAAKLVKVLPKAIELTYVESTQVSTTDIFFGSVTPPSTYDFLLSLGISEPDFLPSTNTSFSLGTQYKNWGPNHREWTQSFHRPLPAYNGVAFHHYLTRLKTASPELSEIETYIMSVQAAKTGAFAHPPEGQKIPLADVEYGYHALPEDWRKVLTTKIANSSIRWVKADPVKIIRQVGDIQSVSLSNGDSLEADFFIDALGPNSELTSPSQEVQSSGRQLKAISSFEPAEKLKNVSRTVTGTDFGWRAETPLQNGIHHLTVFAPTSATEALGQTAYQNQTSVEVKLGRLTSPWSGNCLTLGHGAALVEPLTTAPMLLLQRDIERLAELIPVKHRMKVESREYDRRFNADYEHADLFSTAFFVTDDALDTPYWNAATAHQPNKKLWDKIAQFKSRGVNVQYDYEPFNAEDWTMLHLGMGRYPARYDPLADHIPEEPLKQRLNQMKTAIDMMAKKMPPHQIYMTGLLKYLKGKHG